MLSTFCLRVDLLQGCGMPLLISPMHVEHTVIGLGGDFNLGRPLFKGFGEAEPAVVLSWLVNPGDTLSFLQTEHRQTGLVLVSGGKL